MIIRVTNSAELAAAFASAADGATIMLAPGEYDAVRLRRRDFDDTLTITSEDPANRAVFVDRLWISAASNIAVKGVDFADKNFLEGVRPLLQLQQVTGVSITDARIAATRAGDEHQSVESLVGATKKDGAVAGFANRDGILISESADVEISQVHFTGMRKAVRAADVDGLVIANNHLEEVREDGMHLGYVRNVLISDNLLENFMPLSVEPGSKLNDHSDMIAIINRSEDVPTQNIVIQGNVLRSDNGRSSQGISLANTKTAGATGEFLDVVIRDNVINSVSRNALQITDVSNIVIENNALLQAPRVDGDYNPPRIILKTLADQAGDFRALPNNIVIRNNIIMQNFQRESVSSQIEQSNYEILGIVEIDNVVIRPEREFSWDASDQLFFSAVYPHLVGRTIQSMADLEPATAFAHRFSPGAGPSTLLQALRYGVDGLPPRNPSRPVPVDGDHDPFSPGVQALLAGGDAGDVLRPMGAGAIVLGLGGDDTLHDTSGDDALFGGAGDDRLWAANGNDLLHGGSGSDWFMIRGDRTGANDTVRIADLNFDEGDVLRLTNFATDTFVRPSGSRDVSVRNGGSRVTIDSVEGLLEFGRMENVTVARIADGGDVGYAFTVDLGAAGALTLRILQTTSPAPAPGTGDDGGQSGPVGGGELYIAPWDRDDVTLRQDTLLFLRDNVAPTPSSTTEINAVVRDLLSLRADINLWPGLDDQQRSVYFIDLDRDGVVDRTLNLFMPQDDWQ